MEVKINVIYDQLLDCVKTLAAVFWIVCKTWSKDLLRPVKRELQKTKCEKMNGISIRNDGPKFVHVVQIKEGSSVSCYSYQNSLIGQNAY